MAERQDREGNTQEARRGAQEGPGRPLGRPQRRRRAARRAARALGLRPRRCATRMTTPRATSSLLIATPDVVGPRGRRPRCFGERRLGVAAGRSRRSPPSASSPACSSASRQVGFKPSAAGAQAGAQEAQPAAGRQADLRHRTRCSRATKSIVKVVAVGAIAAARRCCPSSRSSPRWSACRRPCCCPSSASIGARDRPARRASPTS